MSQPKSSTPTPAVDVSKAVTAANTGGADLEKAATLIIDQIGLPVFKQALVKQPELKQLKSSLVVDLISSSLATDLFDGSGANDDVIVQLQNGYVTVPAAQREILTSGITRVLTKRIAEIEQLLVKGK